jgi:hypothetical protein
MPKRAKEPIPLTRITQIALELPEVSRRVHGHHAAFLVRKKVFAYYLHNHHGDGIVSLAAKALPGDNTSLVGSQPSAFISPPTSVPVAGSPSGSIAARSIGPKSTTSSLEAMSSAPPNPWPTSSIPLDNPPPSDIFCSEP